MKRLFAIIFTFIQTCQLSYGQVNAKLEAANIMIGDQTTLTISNTDQFPTIDELSHNEIIPITQEFDTIEGKLHQQTVITCFEEGEHYIMISPTDSLLLKVQDVAAVDTTKAEIRDIADYMHEPITFEEIWKVASFIISGLGMIALIIMLIVYFVRCSHHRKNIVEISKAPPLPADIKAKNSLERLRLQQLWQQGKVKEYHTELTDILRVYLAESYGIQSTEMTSDQTLEAFESTSACDTDTEAMLRRILQTADMVKFAKSEPQPYEHDRSLADAKQFVESTKPIETPEE